MANMIPLQQIIKVLGIATAVDESLIIQSINTLSKATNNELSFLDNKKYIKDLTETKALAVLVHADFKKYLPNGCIALVCEEPYVALAKASQLFAPKLIELQGEKAILGKDVIIKDHVSLGLNVKIGNHSTLMPGVVIGDNVSIGSHTIIYPNVVVYRDCIIGDDGIIHAGTVIGSDGFGFAISKTGEYTKIYQNGNVIIGNNVEIGANCTIDRAVFSSTIIEQQCRIDNLIHIAHNCHLGKGCVLAAQVGLSGSTILGEHVVMAGKAATTGHLTIAPFTTLSGRAVATKSVRKPGQYAGYPLMEHKKWLRLKAKLQRFLKS